MTVYCLSFTELNLDKLSRVGGKNAALGELFTKLSAHGIRIPDGFATTTEAYRELLRENEIEESLRRTLTALDRERFSNLAETGAAARELVLQSRLPDHIDTAIRGAYRALQQRVGGAIQVAVRSSATAEDLPSASFAGLHESFLNIADEEALLDACRRCFASLFTDRAIKYREDHGFAHEEVALCIGVQQMVRADSGCSGVAFTIDPETGHDRVIFISGTWGLGENVVQGTVNPDEFVLYKPNLGTDLDPVITRKLGSKEQKMVYAQAGAGTSNVATTPQERCSFVLNSEELAELGRWCKEIEAHFGRAMDIEWARDGENGQMFIVQARPETVHATRDPRIIHTFSLQSGGRVLCEGIGLGSKIAAGRARLLASPAEVGKLQQGDVLVTDTTSPDWDPVMKKAAAIVTNKGGRTSHAAIVAREVGAVAVVGCGDATEVIEDGQWVTVSSAEGQVGKVYEGELEWQEQALDTRDIQLPQTEVMMILGDPDKALRLSFLPNAGIGLMRLEFIINNSIRVHPMALVKFAELEDEAARTEIERLTAGYPDRENYFIDSLAGAVATIAAAFHPRDVIVRMSDFKSNEYANLLGGRQFEPHEENPMLGFRGASRYYSQHYREGFRLECEAMKRVRNDMGLTNVKLMIPFCRTVEEGERVVQLMADYGLQRGHNGLEIYVMVEIPSNVLLAEEFARHFDGFSIGSNDLTQLTLGLDRDSELVSDLFDENNKAVTTLISQVIASAARTGTKIGLCGQAPSDFPEFARFLVEQGIDSISFNPDALVQGIANINEAERS